MSNPHLTEHLTGRGPFRVNERVAELEAEVKALREALSESQDLVRDQRSGLRRVRALSTDRLTQVRDLERQLDASERERSKADLAFQAVDRERRGLQDRVGELERSVKAVVEATRPPTARPRTAPVPPTTEPPLLRTAPTQGEARVVRPYCA